MSCQYVVVCMCTIMHARVIYSEGGVACSLSPLSPCTDVLLYGRDVLRCTNQRMYMNLLPLFFLFSSSSLQVRHEQGRLAQCGRVYAGGDTVQPTSRGGGEGMKKKRDKRRTKRRKERQEGRKEGRKEGRGPSRSTRCVFVCCGDEQHERPVLTKVSLLLPSHLPALLPPFSLTS